MARVVVDARARDGDRFLVEGDAFGHAVKVLRVGAGDRLHIVDGSGIEYECVAEDVSGRSLIARIVRARRLPGATRVSLRLYCPLLKGDRLDLVLQKSTEIGVASIVTYRAARATVRLAAEDEEGRRSRWNRILTSAVAQCGRPTVPSLGGPLPFSDMLVGAAAADLAIMPWEGDGIERLPRLSPLLRKHARAASVSVVVGPEGGFSPGEVEAARAAGIQPVTLGSRILRAETAALVVPALVLAAYGDLG